jgi:hypothetical protein
MAVCAVDLLVASGGVIFKPGAIYTRMKMGL